MGKFIVFLLGLAVILFVGYQWFRAQPTTVPSAPTDTLDRVRAKTHHIEVQEQEQVDDILKKTKSP